MATGTGTVKGGYDYDFVTPPPKSLECVICLLILRDPHVISCCGNEFCQVCIQRLQRDGRPCPLCNEANFTTFLHKKLVREVNALMIYCPHKELGCEWKGELGRLQQHLDPEAGRKMGSSTEGCGFVIVTCSYQCGAELSRNQIHEHELEACPRRPIERQIASLVRKFEAVVIDNQVLRQELNELKCTHQTEMERIKEIHVQELQSCRQDWQLHQTKLEMVIDDVRRQNDQLERANQDLNKKCGELQEACISLKSNHVILKEYLDKHKATIEQKCTSLETHTIPLPMPPFYFIMANFKHLKNAGCSWFSDPFYTHPGGYKMSVTVFPNGFADGRGTHLSVYVSIIRGEFDNQLHWPFNGEVNVQTYNHTTDQWLQNITIVLKESHVDEGAICKPLEFGNDEEGYSKYLSHSTLRDDYLKDDLISFRVTSVKLDTN